MIRFGGPIMRWLLYTCLLWAATPAIAEIQMLADRYVQYRLDYMEQT